MVTVPPDWLVTGTWMKTLSAVPSVVKVPPEATVTLPAPLTVELPLELDSRVSVPPLSMVEAAPIDRSALPADTVDHNALGATRRGTDLKGADRCTAGQHQGIGPCFVHTGDIRADRKCSLSTSPTCWRSNSVFRLLGPTQLSVQVRAALGVAVATTTIPTEPSHAIATANATANLRTPPMVRSISARTDVRPSAATASVRR